MIICLQIAQGNDTCTSTNMASKSRDCRKKLPWGVRWFESSILRFDHCLIVFKENKITVKSSFMKFNITENKTVFLNLTKYFELTSVLRGGVIFRQYCASCQYSFQWLAFKFSFLKRFRDFIVLSNVFTSRVVFKTWLTLKYTLRGPRQFLTFFLPMRKGLLV